MPELKNSQWISLIKTYKELRSLWDPKHENYTDKEVRQRSYEKLYMKYKQINGNGSYLRFLLYFKKKFFNMRTTYNRERKKVRLYKKKGKIYKPTLWYYKHLHFLDTKLDTAHKRTPAQVYFNRYDNKIYLEDSPLKSAERKVQNSSSNESSTPSQVKVKVKSGYIRIGPLQSSEEEDNTENIQPSPETPKKNPLVDLLKKQKKFIAVVTKMLSIKDKDWQVVGKAIGQQLCSLEPKQRTVAHKLINDAIFLGNKDTLTVESFVDVSERDSPFNIKEEHVYYIDS